MIKEWILQRLNYWIQSRIVHRMCMIYDSVAGTLDFHFLLVGGGGGRQKHKLGPISSPKPHLPYGYLCLLDQCQYLQLLNQVERLQNLFIIVTLISPAEF